MSDPALNILRMRQARETLTAAMTCCLREPLFYGSIGATDPTVTFIEAKRNLTALIRILHGEESFLRTLREDG